MPPLAPDKYHPSVHNHTDENPRWVAVVARSMYRSRRLAMKITPRQHAKNYLRHELLRVGKNHILKSLDHGGGDLYFHIDIGPTCAGLPRTKIKAYVYGQGEHIFSTLELLAEIETERRQPVLL